MAQTKTKIIIALLMLAFLCPLASQAKLIKPSIREKWLGYEYVIELELGRLLTIRKVGYKYFGTVYDKINYLWLPMQEITYLEFKDLLEQGIIPQAFRS